MNLIYMATPIFGGWITMTAHLALKYDYPLYKISKSGRNEKKKRDFGYDVKYQNLSIDELVKKDNILITALDKHYYEYLDRFPDNTTIIMHDPNDFKSQPVLDFLKRVNVITIREAVKKKLLTDHNIQSVFKFHPFYEYDKNLYKSSITDKYITTSRIDFDKNTDIVLRANKLISDEQNHIQMYGKENRLYVEFNLKKMDLKDDYLKYWKGRFLKTLPMSYEDKDLLNNCKYVIDLSVIKGDGGGTQYTFLEAIYQDCVLILHKDWVEKGELFKKGYNCHVVGYTDNVEQELANIIENIDSDIDMKILENSKEILNDNINVVW